MFQFSFGKTAYKCALYINIYKKKQRHFCRYVRDSFGREAVLLMRQQIFPEDLRKEMCVCVEETSLGCGKTASQSDARRHFLPQSRLLCCPFPRGLFFYSSEQPFPHHHRTVLHCPLVWQTLL